MKYKNPWCNIRNEMSHQEFDSDGRNITDYKGYQIVEWSTVEFHVLKDGVLLTMMAGPNGAKSFIEETIRG